MNEELTSILAYSKEKFVERAAWQELSQWVLPTATPPEDGSAVTPSPVRLKGDFGIGKSWLAYHLCSARSLGVGNPLLVSLVPAPPKGTPLENAWFVPSPSVIRETSDSEANLKLVEEILRWLGEKAGVRLPQNSASDMIFLLTSELARRSTPLILLVDGLGEVPDSLLGPLESYLLAPLASLPHVRLVLVEPSSYPWRLPALRMEGKLITLTPFNEAQTREQLEKLPLHHPIQEPETLTAIRNLGRGNPLHTACLAAAVSGERTLDEGLKRGVELIVAQMLQNVAPSSRARFRAYLEALSVREAGFHETMILPLLNAHPEAAEGPTDSSGNDLKRARDHRDELLAAKLIVSKGALYQVEEPIRWLLEQYLKEYRPQVWIRLHRAAYNFYKEWATKVKAGNQAYYTEEAARHQQRLAEIEQPPA